MSTTIFTLRLDARLNKQSDKLASAPQPSKSFLAAEAIREYIALNDWQIEEIKKAVKEADRGDFAAERDVQKVMKKLTRMRARRLRAALAELDAEAEYIAQDNPRAAARVVSAIAIAGDDWSGIRQRAGLAALSARVSWVVAQRSRPHLPIASVVDFIEMPPRLSRGTF